MKLDLNKFNTLTLETYDAFMLFLEDFDKDYWKTSDRRVYTANKKMMDVIETITCKSKEFNVIFDLWYNKCIDELNSIRESLLLL